ncbi:hypothetical protein HA402_001830 [Bradysia odoriphaga]|nr:hypothetical protein HA402_001830 [Bradysia odoriphaga]
MYSLILIALFLSSEGNAEDIRKSQAVPFVMGGTKVNFTITGIKTEEDVLLKCVVQFFDGRGSIEVEPILPSVGDSVICQLPPDINSGSVIVDVEARRTGRRAVSQSTKTVLVSEVVFINAIPLAKLVVVENWNTNELTFTWDSEYIQQYFNPGATIILQVTLYAANSMEPIFAATAFAPIIGLNTGATTIAITAANVDRISNIDYPYFYVLRPVGAPNVYMSSVLYAPTLRVTENEASRTCRNWLNTAEAPVPDEINPCPPCLCQAELDDNFVQSEYDPQLLRLSNGALDNHVLYYERVPTNAGHAQTCSYDTSTRNLATTSPAQASWIHAISKYTSYQSNFFDDIWPYIACCIQSNSQQLCDQFHERRPIDTGHEYPGPENPICGWGDPHFVTYNNLMFDFMGYGEFWLIRGSNKSGFGVQGRMGPYAAWPRATLFNAVAIKDGNTTVQFELRNYASFHLILNSTELPIPVEPTTLPLRSAHINFIHANLINVRLQTGFTIIVENIGNLYLNVYGSGAQRNKGKGFMGLFGNFDFDTQKELTSQDGFVIPPTSALDMSLIHNRFGLTWMTTANESIFHYQDGRSWNDYVDPDFLPLLQHPDPATMPEEVRAICGDSLFCFYEYVVTGSLEMAADVVRVETGLEERRDKISNTVRPMCDVIRSPVNGRVHVNGHFNGSIATYSCNKEYDFESGDRIRTCFASENESNWVGEEPVCIWTCTTCEQNTEFELTHNPADCAKFFLCSFGIRLALECPMNTAFNPATQACADDYVCRDTPGC